MLTERDIKAIDYLHKFKCCTTEQLWKLAYINTSLQYTRRRLTQLYEWKEVQRNEKHRHIDAQFVYWVHKKPEQIAHRLRLVDAYISLGMPEEFQCEAIYGNLRADGYTEIQKDNKLFSLFVEIHLFNGFNFEKYIDLYKSGSYKKYFQVMPRVAIVADKKLKMPESDIKFIQVKSDFSNLEEVFS